MRSSRDDPRCRACHSEQISDRIAIPDFEYCTSADARYGLCQACGSFTQSPMPTGAELSSYYPARYHSFLPPSRLSRSRQKLRIDRLRKLAHGESFRQSVLDFGCGQGLFLTTLAEAFPEGRFFGYEIADENVQEQRLDGRLTIFRGDPEFFWEHVPSLDIVTMNHVVEHLPEPLAVLRQISSKLRPGGVLEGQTPNSNSFERKIFGTRWSGFHAPRHTVIFSRTGLDTALRNAGFDRVEITSGFNPAGWAVSLASVLQDSRHPTGVKRDGLAWLALVVASILPSFIESRTQQSGIIDFQATKSG